MWSGVKRAALVFQSLRWCVPCHFVSGLGPVLHQRSCFARVVIYSCHFLPLLVTSKLCMYVHRTVCIYRDVYRYLQHTQHFFSVLEKANPLFLPTLAASSFASWVPGFQTYGTPVMLFFCISFSFPSSDPVVALNLSAAFSETQMCTEGTWFLGSNQGQAWQGQLCPGGST